MDIWFTLFVVFVALFAAAGVSMLLVGYLEVVPAAVTFGWRWVSITLALPVLGPIWFCRQHWDELDKTGRKLIFGSILLLLAVALLYGFGPLFAARVLAKAPPG
ncbi:MAG: hypothetical protein RIR00_782 [Pseudomonadota bacterium]|jgi:hypothetical protein